MTTSPCSPAPLVPPAGLVFLTQAVRAPVSTGALAPSGRALTRALVAPVQERGGADLRVLEVGAGSGPVTRALLGLLSAGSRLDVVEANGAFVPLLHSLVASSPVRTRVHHARFPDVDGLDTGYDVIVSALPFSNFTVPAVGAILDRYQQLLGPGGVITWFSYRGSRTARTLTASAAEAARHRAVHDHLRDRGGSSATIWANLPPARVTRLRPRG